MPHRSADPLVAERPGSSPGGVLRVDILGTPVVTVAGLPLVVDTRKAVALLAVLAVGLSEERAEVPRAELAAMLWPEVDESRARGALRRTLSVLVAATGDAVRPGRLSIALDPGATGSDVVMFRRLAASGDREDLARAAGLVRGRFLAGFSLRDAAAFDDWSAGASEALRRELGAVLERLVVARLRHGELHAGLADAARWLELDPLHEAAHRSFMRLLAWTGRRQDALDHYQRCVRLLGDELAVAPVRATTEVYEAIRNGTLPPPRRFAPATGSPVRTAPDGARVTGPAPGWTSRRPVQPPLTGRADALGALLDTVGGGSRLVVLSGEAGVGRSRLVDEFTARTGRCVLARAHSGESVLAFAPVADLLRAAIALAGPPPADLAAEVARLLPELAAGAAGSPLAPLSSLGARDRFYDAVLRVLAGSGANAVLVEDVHAMGDASAGVIAYLVHRLDRLPFPLVLTWRDPGLAPRNPVQAAIAAGRHEGRTTVVALERLSREEVATLTALVASRSDASGSDGPPRGGLDADAIWRDTAGLPLLVVAALRSDGDDLPLTVRDTLAARLAEVSEETAQVLAALAVLGGVADPGDLTATSGRTDDETVEAVEEAMRVGVIREEGAAVAFAHDALRRVAYEQLSLVRRRLLHLRAAEALADRPDSEVWAGAIAGHLHEGGRDTAAVEWAWTAADRARHLFDHAGALHALDLVASLGRDDAAVTLARGEALVALARYEPARAAFARAMALTSDPSARADVERRLADVAVRCGEWGRAADGLDAALEWIDRTRDDAGLRARLLADRALVASRAGHHERATDYAQAAVAAAAPVSPYVLDVAGIVALGSGDDQTAVDRFAAALAVLAAAAGRGEGDDLALRAAVLNNQARALAAAGQRSRAVDIAREALLLGRRIGDRHRLAALLTNLADRLHELGTPEAGAEALTHLTESAGLFAEVDADPLGRPDVWTLTSW